MVLYPVHRLIFKILFKKMGRAYWALRARTVFLCGFARKKCHDPLSEHDYKDLNDLQDCATSCPSFNLLNLVQEDGQGARGWGA